MTETKPSKPRLLADYRAEAAREPFVLQIDDDTAITIPPPTSNTMMDIDEVYTTRGVLKLLAGDQYDALMAAIGEEPGDVLLAIGKDMRRHFGLGG